MDVYDVSREAVEGMRPVDLRELRGPPESPIGEFELNDAICGIGCFAGRPPWECHTAGDELLHVLAGETELTTADDSGLRTRTLRAGSIVVVPRGRWHRNSAPDGVTVFYVTPREGNLHSWAEEDPGV